MFSGRIQDTVKEDGGVYYREGEGTTRAVCSLPGGEAGESKGALCFKAFETASNLCEGRGLSSPWDGVKDHLDIHLC